MTLMPGTQELFLKESEILPVNILPTRVGLRSMWREASQQQVSARKAFANNFYLNLLILLHKSVSKKERPDSDNA